MPWWECRKFWKLIDGIWDKQKHKWDKIKITDWSTINTEAIHTEIIDTECGDTRLIEAELKIWKKVADVAYAEGKHPDEVYVDFMVMFSEFLEKKYTTKKYPTEKSADEKSKKTRSRKVKKTSQNEWDDWMD